MDQTQPLVFLLLDRLLEENERAPAGNNMPMVPGFAILIQMGGPVFAIYRQHLECAELHHFIVLAGMKRVRCVMAVSESERPPWRFGAF
jgi:hypothetical protein